jgi:hypothetical protein
VWPLPANTFVPQHSTNAIGNYLIGTDEELLISAARSADTRAFDELYTLHSGNVLPRIFRITTNQEDAEDVLQEVTGLSVT